MVVEILPEDLPDLPAPFNNSLKVMHFQEQIEKKFFEAAGETQQAPAQRMTDFVDGKLSATLPRSSYPPGLLSRRIDELLPATVTRRLREGFKIFNAKQRGFLSPEAVLIGDETRTSSPVRIPRDKETLCHISIDGLYPCGEGAGYAGGIVSAALDGIASARAVAIKLKNEA